MSEATENFDCAIVGGGVAGLCLSIQLARLGHSVVLFEKGRYPFHKVCGEYISNESFDFLCRLGLPLREWQLPQINNIGISSAKGFMLRSPLVLGGFGLSRYKMDHELAIIARKAGVAVREQTKVTDIDGHTITTNKGIVTARVVAGAFGKADPVFAKDAHKSNNDNYIGVKYHIRTDFPADRIELHNFRDGYCGISKVEDDACCLCYLAHATLLKENNNSIPQMEEQVLHRNPHLRAIFSNCDHLFAHPVTVSNVKFKARKTVDGKLLYLGDAAGCITPLTGNGMSMACYTAHMLAGLIDKHLAGQSSYEALGRAYTAGWNDYFLARIKRGRRLQYIMAQRQLSDIALRLLSPMSSWKSALIESTHGQPF